MTTRDVVTPIANLIERLWPRDIAYPKRDQRAPPAIYPVAGAARSMDPDCGGNNCAKPSSPSVFSLADLAAAKVSFHQPK
jgi:hypothetical protein